MKITYRKGDKFRNGNGTTSTIFGITPHKLWLRTTSGYEYEMFIKRVNKLFAEGTYNYYRPVTPKKYTKYKKNDWVLMSGEANGWGSSPEEICSKVLQISSIINDRVVFLTGERSHPKEIVRLARANEIPVRQIEWKKEDFINTKIIIDTPEKSKKFQTLVNSLGISFFNSASYLNDKYLFLYKTQIKKTGNNDKRYFNEHKNREIFYDDIFPEENSINNKQSKIKKNGKSENSSDVPGKNYSVGQRKINGRPRISSRRQQIATGSRPKGNIQRANCTRAKSKRVKICGRIGLRTNIV